MYVNTQHADVEIKWMDGRGGVIVGYSITYLDYGFRDLKARAQDQYRYVYNKSLQLAMDNYIPT